MKETESASLALDAVWFLSTSKYRLEYEPPCNPTMRGRYLLALGALSEDGDGMLHNPVRIAPLERVISNSFIPVTMVPGLSPWTKNLNLRISQKCRSGLRLPLALNPPKKRGSVYLGGGNSIQNLG